MPRRSPTALAVVLLLAAPAAAQQPAGAFDGLARLVSPKFRQVDDRLRELLAAPTPRAAPANCPNLGYHSRAAYAPNSPRWVQVDLGATKALDAVVVIPAIGPPGESGPGYCFPPEMRVELANEPDASDAVTVAELRERGNRPLVIDAGGRAARFVRVTATRLAAREGLYFFALGELVALSGNLNVAAGRPVSATDSIDNAPVWGLRNLTDGQSFVGPPLGAERSPANGYHSAVSPTADAVKWVQVDLGSPRPLDEVRLIPARPSDFADRSGFAFPLRFRVEAANDPDFRDARLLLSATESDFPNPGDGVVTVPASGVTARHVRVTVTKLWERTGDYAFALAEMQVYSRGVNAAAGAPVAALDTIDRGLWGRRHLVDGCASQYRLLEWPEWAEAEREASAREAEAASLQAAWALARAGANARLIYGTAALVAGVILAAALLLWRSRVLRRRDAERLRDRIQRDLHDEVGSNLGGILLLAQAGGPDDLPAIARIARETSESMRDLVWLMGRRGDTGPELLLHMRETAAVLLAGLDYTFDAGDQALPTRVPIEFKRQFYFAFKETLHNVARHAAARHAAITLAREGRLVVLEVRDDGRGFDPDTVKPGTGLRSLKLRAAALGGEFGVTSAPGNGTTVRLTAKL